MRPHGIILTEMKPLPAVALQAVGHLVSAGVSASTVTVTPAAASRPGFLKWSEITFEFHIFRELNDDSR